MRKALFLSGFLITCLLIFYACKKVDAIKNPSTKPQAPADRFFTVSSNAPSEIKAIANDLKLQNDRASLFK